MGNIGRIISKLGKSAFSSPYSCIWRLCLRYTCGIVLGASFIPALATDAHAEEYWIRVNAGNSVNISTVPESTDKLMIGKGNVSVETDAPSGYSLYISGLEHTADNNAGLYLEGDKTAESVIRAIDSSIPAVLTSNTWGFAKGGNSSSVGTYGSNNYADSDIYEEHLGIDATTKDPSVINSLTFSGLSGNYQLLHETHSSNTDNPDNIDVYFGALVNKDLEIGNYRNVVVYTAFVDGSRIASLSPTPIAKDNNDVMAAGDTRTIVIQTGHQDNALPVTKDQITEIKLYDSANPSADIATCDLNSIAIDSVNNGTYGNPLKFTCSLTRGVDAANSTETMYDIKVTVNTDGKGRFIDYEANDVWRFLATWNYSLTFNGNGATSGVPSNQTGTEVETVTSVTKNTGNAPSRTDYTFASWSDGGATYSANQGITLTPDSPTKALTANWNRINITYKINFNADGKTASGMPSTVTDTQYLDEGHSKSLSIPNTVPTNADYNFKGWAATSGGSIICSAGASCSYAVNWTSGTTAETTLYAIWESKIVRLTGNMQDLTTTNCNAATTWDSTQSAATTYTMTDSRDSKQYLVRKLADGNCWMAQNLALEDNTNGAARSVVTWNWSAKTAGTYALPASSWFGFSSHTAAYMYNGSHKNATANNTSDNTGAYYSFLAATAGTGIGSSGEATTSICPKGWRLPSKDMFVTLAKKYGGTGESIDANIGLGSDFSNAYNAALVGHYYDSSLSGGGSGGYWWSSTIRSGTDGYSLSLGTSISYPQYDYYKGVGFSLRCIFSGQ